MFGVETVDHTQAAAFDFLPLLFVAYIVYAIIVSLAKAAKQVRQAQPSATAAAPAQQMTADAVRAALTRRLATVATRVAPTAVVSTSPSATRSQRGLPDSTPASFSTAGSQGSRTPAAVADFPDANASDLRSLLANLPPAAQAIVASAIIGPCASHRGSGHTPEDW